MKINRKDDHGNVFKRDIGYFNPIMHQQDTMIFLNFIILKVLLLFQQILQPMTVIEDEGLGPV